MQSDRWAPCGALLPGGTSALIAGGYSYKLSHCVDTVDRFDERRLRFSASHAHLAVARDFAIAISLGDGTILIVGGFNDDLGSLDSAELFDPKHDSMQLLPSRMSSPRELATAILLDDGRVFIAAGFSTHRGRTLYTADLYDPKTQTFTQSGSQMVTDRFGHAAVKLKDGRVLLVGGTEWQEGHTAIPLASAEIYDPQTDEFHRTAGDMAVPRDRPTATLLADGRVLIAGGQNGKAGTTALEVFDPATERFTTLTAQLSTDRMAHSAETMPDGKILVAGGWSPTLQQTTATTELIDAAAQTVVIGPPLPESALDQATVVFSDGSVLAAGGKQVEGGHTRSLDTAAIFEPNR
jgi:hypothetical protein